MKRLSAAFLAALLLLSGCRQAPAEEDKLHILCTTYPMYLLTTDLVSQMEGVEVSLLVNSQTSCLHDYTLTVEDMKAIEGSDVIVMNGAGLEDFMADALAQSDAAVIDCSEYVDLLPALEQEGHEEHEGHEEEYDPHYWMDTGWALMVRNGLCSALEEYTGPIDPKVEYQLPDPKGLWGEVSCPYLITFHDGFQYFADSCGLTLLKAIEEKEGSTASAAEIKEIVALIEEYDIPAIFVERNGSWATAEAIAREVTEKTGEVFTVAELDMLMSGTALDTRQGMDAYLELMERNFQTVAEALK